MGYTDLTYLNVAIDEGIAVVTIDGPHEGNALTYEGQREVASILPRLEADADVAAAVFTGAGDAYCSGPAQDFLEAVTSGSPSLVREVMERVHTNIENCLRFSKPLVSAINGPIAGAPMAQAMLADVIIVERQVQFVDHHVPHGIAAGDGSVLVWPLAMGVIRAKRYLLTGEGFDAEEAFRLGLVTEVVDQGASLPRALEYARKIASHGAAARHTKAALNGWLQLGRPAYDRGWAGEVLTVSGA
ncbi:MAG: 2-ketocyclohexanecarboxyl-CoA hydrolase [Acidimicrobiales bacterium]|nr:2-ketocyclohexanecarboxyl-CoA hydrolase [Acidimicrobiales bacterium]